MPAGGILGEFGQVGRRTEGWELEVLVLNLVLVLVSSYLSVSVCISPIKGSIVWDAVRCLKVRVGSESIYWSLDHLWGSGTRTIELGFLWVGYTFADGSRGVPTMSGVFCLPSPTLQKCNRTGTSWRMCLKKSLLPVTLETPWLVEGSLKKGMVTGDMEVPPSSLWGRDGLSIHQDSPGINTGRGQGTVGSRTGQTSDQVRISGDSSDVRRIVKLGGSIQMAQVGAWVWPFICHTLMIYFLELPSDGGNSPRQLTMEGCWQATFADIGTVSPSVLQGPSGWHSRVSQLCKRPFLWARWPHTWQMSFHNLNRIPTTGEFSKYASLQPQSGSIKTKSESVTNTHIFTVSQVIPMWALVGGNCVCGEMEGVVDMASNLAFQKWLRNLQIEGDFQWLHLSKPFCLFACQLLPKYNWHTIS